MTNEEIVALKEYVETINAEFVEHKSEMATKEELEKLVGAVTKVNAKVISVTDKVDKETKMRELPISSLEDRVTTNEEHIMELEEEIGGMQDQVMDIAGVLKELHNRQDELKDKAVKKALAAVKDIVED